MDLTGILTKTGYVFFLALLLTVLPAPSTPVAAQESPVVNVLYFYATDCTHCQAVDETLLIPLAAEYGAQVNIKRLEIGEPTNYELMIRSETHFKVPADRRDIPTLVLGEHILIGETEIREQLESLIEAGIDAGGVTWPEIQGLTEAVSGGASPFGANDPGTEVCSIDDADACATTEPIWIAYFYQVGCQECSRVKVDLNYMRTQYPQIIIEEFNINDDAALAHWMGQRVERIDEIHPPTIFVGDDVLIGDAEITPQRLEQLMQKYAGTGAPMFWEEFDPDDARAGIADYFRSFKPLMIVWAGLVDGLNPCAFATLIFFVSYLTLSGRKGRQVLPVGIAFALGVFLTYLVIGLGFYKVLDVMGDTLSTLGRWVYGLTALLCAVLAVFSFLDFLKARKGNLKDMNLNLPHALRMRINAVIRKGRNARAFVAGAFVTGILISFLELACTGQIYLPTIISMASEPELRTRAISYLLLYNLMFIVPLVVVFIMAYFGTTSKDLTRFLERHAATVKLGMSLLFVSLAAWLGSSLLL